ncbi:hypothetical protein [Corynebacterium parakroppenstedtii]|uniref:hypothetical protein n=1 Tax=Corynebacterium parakroppenstedtii TaxID=2828363 RepID=UPI001C8F55FE|nr:hypothetical protein [Corynebacterium parakroppenstedtii]MBY0795274.1 hypothetical protein [Corynebacterium parakroppenstedtii]
MADNGVNEDRLMGPFFLPLSALPKENDGVEAQNHFLEQFEQKVLMYLFEDAGRQCRQLLFRDDDSSKRYSALRENFRKKGIEAFSDDIADNTVEKESADVAVSDN